MIYVIFLGLVCSMWTSLVVMTANQGFLRYFVSVVPLGVFTVELAWFGSGAELWYLTAGAAVMYFLMLWYLFSRALKD